MDAILVPFFYVYVNCIKYYENCLHNTRYNDILQVKNIVYKIQARRGITNFFERERSK